MDPSQVANYLTPLLALALNEGAKGAGGHAGKATMEAGGRALQALRGWRRKSPRVNGAIGQLVVEPDSEEAREELRKALRAFLTEEPELLLQLSAIAGARTLDQRQSVTFDQRRGNLFIGDGTFHGPVAGRDVHVHDAAASHGVPGPGGPGGDDDEDDAGPHGARGPAGGR